MTDIFTTVKKLLMINELYVFSLHTSKCESQTGNFS